jgi:hypothetical protein
MNIEDMRKRLEAVKLIIPREANKLIGMMAIELQLEIYAQNAIIISELQKMNASKK